MEIVETWYFQICVKFGGMADIFHYSLSCNKGVGQF